ncbi:baseplate J/gp47 family protein [Photorhabdus heterorhabditis]|uniref:baseplate J/gp47 family protein n=1 Tax=Photorhabdus heterorhabditis TaxID=880156 RepID=UPI0015622F37
MMLNLDTLGLSATVTASGISAPDYQTILSKITEFARQIYGTDAYLEPDSKDGQMLAIFSLAIHDANNAVIAAYNSFSPASATGAALSNNVKINGIARHASTYSTVDVKLIGTVGTVVKNGIVRDINGYSWSIPSSVAIGIHGFVIATATCQTKGNVTALVGDVSIIGTPTQGWQNVTNLSAATPGQPIEADTALRERQRKSVALPSRTVLDGIQGAISLIPGVVRRRGFENDTNVTDNNGIPPHSIAMIVDGGDAKLIAQTIETKKGPGAGTFGDTEIKVADSYGLMHPIHFSRPKDVPVFVEITLTAFEGYTTLVGDRIRSAIASYIDAQLIGDNVYLSRLYSPANLRDEEGLTYDIFEIQIGRSEDDVSPSNLIVTFDEAVTCKPEHVKLIAR